MTKKLTATLIKDRINKFLMLKIAALVCLTSIMLFTLVYGLTEGAFLALLAFLSAALMPLRREEKD